MSDADIDVTALDDEIAYLTRRANALGLTLRASPWRDTAEELPENKNTCFDEVGNLCYYSERAELWTDLATRYARQPPKQWAYITDLLPEVKE